MSFVNRLRLWNGFLLMVLVAGCGEAAPREPVATTGTDEPHPHRQGQHGGIIVPIGRSHYHTEVIFEDKGVLKLIMLQKDETRLLEVPKQSLKAYVKIKSRMEAASFALQAEPQQGDSPGMTSQFTGKLPDECAGEELLVSVPQIAIAGERFRFSFERASSSHPSMPAKVSSDEEENLYLKPGGKYTLADIASNGKQTASQRYASFRANHDLNPKTGDSICPITLTKSNPGCFWIVDGQRYEFCCPPCIDEFVRIAKEEPDRIKPVRHFVKK